MGQGVDEVCRISTKPCFSHDTPCYFDPEKFPHFLLDSTVRFSTQKKLWNEVQTLDCTVMLLAPNKALNRPNPVRTRWEITWMRELILHGVSCTYVVTL